MKEELKEEDEYFFFFLEEIAIHPPQYNVYAAKLKANLKLTIFTNKLTRFTYTIR